MTRVRLRAKRRWGELLPEPEMPKAGPGRGHKTCDESSRVSDAERKQTERARKLAAIPKEAFESALENSEPDRSEGNATSGDISNGADRDRSILIAERGENTCRKDFTPSEMVALAMPDAP